MFFHHMIWLLPRPALALGAAFALCGLAAAPAAAQSAAASAAVSAAPASGATDTVTPRRRPTRRAAVRPDSSHVHTASSRAASERTAAERSAMLSVALRAEGRGWLGIPYRWGGSSRRGIDCSAFTQQFVRETMGIELPRATAGQQYEGVPVSRSELRSGDLVFFRRGSVRHVGVYLSDGDFIHASSSNGVTVSNLSETYYARHYWMARRILTDPSGRRPTPRFGTRSDSSSVRG